MDILIGTKNQYKATEIARFLEKLPDRVIPEYRWMGHLWYYPQYKNVFNKLSEREKEGVRKQGAGIKRSLRRKIREILK